MAWDWVAIAEGCTALGTLALAGSTWWLAQTTRNEAVERDRPIIVVEDGPYFEEGDGNLSAVLRNVGRGPALQVYCEARYDDESLQIEDSPQVLMAMSERDGPIRINIPVRFIDGDPRGLTPVDLDLAIWFEDLSGNRHRVYAKGSEFFRRASTVDAKPGSA